MGDNALQIKYKRIAEPPVPLGAPRGDSFIRDGELSPGIQDIELQGVGVQKLWSAEVEWPDYFILLNHTVIVGGVKAGVQG